jgi:hypothetical protein
MFSSARIPAQNALDVSLPATVLGKACGGAPRRRFPCLILFSRL